jgi:hypothetical protein
MVQGCLSRAAYSCDSMRLSLTTLHREISTICSPVSIADICILSSNEAMIEQLFLLNLSCVDINPSIGLFHRS